MSLKEALEMFPDDELFLWYQRTPREIVKMMLMGGIVCVVVLVLGGVLWFSGVFSSSQEQHVENDVTEPSYVDKVLETQSILLSDSYLLDEDSRER